MLCRARKGIGALALAAVLTVSVWADWKVGDVVPDLAGFGLEGDLPELAGRVTYVDFWATWCAPCKASFPEVERLYLENKAAGFQVLAVSVDTSEKAVSKFVERVKPSFAIVRDGKQELVAAAGIEVMPTSFLVDAKGVIRKVHIGWRGVETASQLEKEIKELLAEGEL